MRRITRRFYVRSYFLSYVPHVMEGSAVASENHYYSAYTGK